MRILITGIKGGVGKSAIAYSLFKEIAEEKPCLLLDMDNTLTISRMLGLKQSLAVEKVGNLLIMPAGNKIDREDIFEINYLEYLKKNYTVIIDASNPLIQALKVENKISSQINTENLILVVSLQMPYVLMKTTEFLEKYSSDFHNKSSNNYALIINMVTNHVNYSEKYYVIRIPFVHDLLFKGISLAPQYINIWNELRKFVK